MSGSSDMKDRLHREMVASERTWSSEEIAREVLKIVSDATRADRLVGAVLGTDPRFVRDGARWRALSDPAPALEAAAFLLCDLPPGGPSGSLQPLGMRPWDPSTSRPQRIVEIAVDGSGLESARGYLEGRLPVSVTAPAARRRLHDLERCHALPALSERLLDLAAVLKLVGERVPPVSTAADAAASMEERLHVTEDALRRVLELFGSLPLEELEGQVEESLRARPVDFTPFLFTREELDMIPERPGVYRFGGEGRKLLYVGKSRDLRRRVASYFRPLAPDHQRRARLLEQIRSMEWEAVPSELEALLMEAEAIRREGPTFNQQVAIHPESIRTTAQDSDLGFVLCEGDPDSVSIFLHRERSPWARGRLPRGPIPAAAEASLRVVRAWTEGTFGAAAGILTSLDEEGATLVGRYLRLNRDSVDRLRLSDFADERQAAEALAALAVRPRPAWDPWSLRAPTC